jgi:hypothetical protein
MTGKDLPEGWTIIMDDSLDGDAWWWGKHVEHGRTDTYRTIETVIKAIKQREYYNVQK